MNHVGQTPDAGGSWRFQEAANGQTLLPAVLLFNSQSSRDEASLCVNGAGASKQL